MEEEQGETLQNESCLRGRGIELKRSGVEERWCDKGVE